MAAVEASKGGARVTLVDDQADLGGHLRYRRYQTGSGADSAFDLVKQIESLPNFHLLKNTSCFGFYEGGLLGIVQRNHISAAERLIHLRTKRIVVATGAYEVPMVFENNDLVGVMLSSAVERLINLHGIKPAQTAVIVAPGQDGERSEHLSRDLQAAGVRIASVIPPNTVLRATGRGRLTGIVTTERHIPCDLAVVCGHLVPDAGLIAQAGGALKWDEELRAFVPASLPPTVFVAGGATGTYDLEVIMAQGKRAGARAARSLNMTAANEDEEPEHPAVSRGERSIASSSSPILHPQPSGGGRSFVCLCEDVTVKDLQIAISEGFDHIETMKRYTTVTMGPCQGKMCQLSSIVICALKMGRTIGETGTTTSRPPTAPVSLGTLAGAGHHPAKRTPMHYKHDEIGCAWMDMGEWKRPRYYLSQEAKDEKRCVEEEYRAVRERVGIIDVSTLGKLDVKGKDAPKLLDKVYTNRLSDLPVGRARYSVICDDEGIILDDGTISRLSDDHFFITTTTGNIEFVEEWLKWWGAGTGWCVHVANVTGGLAAVNVAGPSARDMLRKLTDCDLGTRAFPYMSCRQTEVGGVPCLMLRIGFVGEAGWEIHFPSEYGEYLWDVLMKAGAGLGIRPFGIEAQRLLRLEKRHPIVGVDTDATSNPFEADMAWVAKLDKDDFIGKAAILRVKERGMREKLVGFVMQDTAVPDDGAAIVVNGKPIGRVTSVRFSPASGRAVGMAWVPAEAAKDGQEIQVHARGRLAKARVVSEVFYDAKGERLRM
jgi:sarcosine oxidase subunit alpha